MRANKVSLIVLVCGVAWVLTPAALAVDLHVSVLSGGEGSVTVSPGAVVNYDIVAELSDDPSEGLAFVLFDLTYSDGPLDQVSAPVGMSSFEIPDGLTNPLPAGYGGTQLGNSLIQVGGAQNTISNTSTYAPYPIGGVVTGIAVEGLPATVATGSLTAPVTSGTYTIDVSNLLAAVIADGEDGSGPYWAVEPAEVGTLAGLTIQVGIPSTPCTTDEDCVLANNNACEWDQCGSVVPGYCDPVVPMVYGDVTGASPRTAPNGAVNTTDILCVLAAFGVGNLGECPNADIAIAMPADCPAGNGVVNLSDILKVLDAFGAPTSPSAVLMCDCPLNP